MEAKQYKYIPELLDEILKYWHESTLTIRSRSSSSSSHLTHIQPTIAHTQPPNTHVIVNTKKSNNIMWFLVLFKAHVVIIWCWVVVSNFP